LCASPTSLDMELINMFKQGLKLSLKLTDASTRSRSLSVKHGYLSLALTVKT